jgi:hypothetical protein
MNPAGYVGAYGRPSYKKNWAQKWHLKKIANLKIFTNRRLRERILFKISFYICKNPKR